MGNCYIILQFIDFSPLRMRFKWDRTTCEKFYKIDDGMGCNCVPQLHAVS